MMTYPCGLNEPTVTTNRYKWREAIPDADLPIAVTARGSCWYGKGCRTQYNPSNPGHGERLNHICDATNDR